MPDEANLIGKQIGSYQIVDLLNSGSFGTVYTGKHLIFEDEPMVAIKVMHTPLSSSQERQKFALEANLLKLLKHPYILPIIDASIQDNLAYLVMEYAPGGSLRDHLVQQPGQSLPLDEVFTILTQIGQALHHAHQHNIVHRDLKPENILFNVKGEAFLADFGLAAILSSVGTNLHGYGGTPAYMAPEMFVGKVSTKSDQYALGCIAYELVTGQKPFEVEGVPLIAVQFQHTYAEPPPPTQFTPHLPIPFEQAILKAMAKDRANRYPDVHVFLTALQAPQKSSQEWMKEVIALCDLDLYEEVFAGLGFGEFGSLPLLPGDLGALLPEELKRYEEALVAFDQVIRLNPNDADVYFNPNDADVYKLKGLVLVGLKRYVEALAAFDQAIRFNPNDADIYKLKGLVLTRLKRYVEALETFDQMIRLNPNDTDIYRVKGLVLVELKRDEEALAAFDQPFNLDPNDADALLIKGLTLCNLKRYAETYDQTLRLNANDIDIYRVKNGILARLGWKREAQQAYEKAKQIKDDGIKTLPKNNVQVENHTIAIIGDNFSGVSTYIGSLLYELREGKMERRYSNISQGILYNESESQFHNNYYVPLFLEKQLLAATQLSHGDSPEPLIYEFLIQSAPGKKAKRVNLIFYDSAGEDICDQEAMVRYVSYLFHASGIIFLADPLAMNGIVRRLPKHINSFNLELPSVILNTVLQTLRQGNTEAQQKFPIPLALTLSKADLLAFTVNTKERSYSFLSEIDRNSPLEPRELQSVSNEVKTVIEQMGDKNLLRATEICSTVEFFAVSATGCSVDEHTYKYPFVKPIRCLDPLIWILWQLGVLEDLH